jgi:hypothetical protein
MTIARLTAYLGLAGAAAAFRAGADEVNHWPVSVTQKDSLGQVQSWEGAGPFLFSAPIPAPEPGHASGFRPFYVTISADDEIKRDYLYPVFFRRDYPGSPSSYKWSILNLINGAGITAEATAAGGPIDRHFDVWPFYFSHETGDPIDTYHALFPIYGTMKYRLWFDQITWAPFPIYLHTYKKETSVTYVPWPIIQITSGASHGFGIWPLFGATSGPGPARNCFFLWPLGYDNTVLPSVNAPDGTPPSTQFGFLPLYTREKGPGVISENYLWPFFGYTERTSPYRYSEQRYFWPFLVQGRGDDRYVNRWGPFFTHSNVKGADSAWVMWPFWHRTSWTDDDIAQTKTQFFYFIYWNLEQKSASRPLAPHAYKRHFWPVLSIWDNGAGSRQEQILSPLEVFFPDNPDMREVWSPLFAVYKYSHSPSGESRHSILWDAITWRRDGSGNLEEFHLGPLLSIHHGPAGPYDRILGFDFGAKPGKDTMAHR